MSLIKAIVITGLFLCAFPCIAGSEKNSKIQRHELNTLLDVVPNNLGGTWGKDVAFVYYNGLARSGNFLYGRFADNLQGACSQTNSVTSILDNPDNWVEPTVGHTCPDNELVLEIRSKNSTPPPSDCARYVRAYLTNSCGFGSRAYKTFLSNSHQNRDIRATIKWRLEGQPYRTDVKTIDAGDTRQIGCSIDVTVTACTFIN